MFNPQKLSFIDNLRVLLILLVVTFHAGAPYAEVPWYTISPETTPLSAYVLSWILTVYAAFMLSLFFMISGYFTPFSYIRKGTSLFWKDRLIRLGAPFLIFFFGVMPLFNYTLYVIDTQGDPAPYTEFLALEYSWNTHHLWFLINILLFTVVYWIIQLPKYEPKKMNTPKNSLILSFVILIALTTFFVRIWYPIGKWDSFKLVQPAYLPQFGGLFMAGVLTYQHQWIKKMPRSVGLTWLKIGIIIALLFPGIYIMSEGNYTVLCGGFHWQPLVFSVWEAFICVGFCVGLTILFREKVTTRELGEIPQNTYAVYLIHLPIVVFLQRALVGTGIYPLTKVAFIILCSFSLSFLGSHYLRKLPFAKKIL
jgi:glucan biosynthesis protein C